MPTTKSLITACTPFLGLGPRHDFTRRDMDTGSQQSGDVRSAASLHSRRAKVRCIKHAFKQHNNLSTRRTCLSLPAPLGKARSAVEASRRLYRPGCRPRVRRRCWSRLGCCSAGAARMEQRVYAYLANGVSAARCVAAEQSGCCAPRQ